MKVIREMHLEDIEGNERTMELVNTLIANGICEEFDRIIDECYPGGMTEEQIETFTKSTVDNQQRLLSKSYVPLSYEELRQIFVNLY